MAQQGIRVAISSNAMGKSRAGHGIGVKLEAAKRHGFDGIELVMECLESHSESEKFATYNSCADRLRAAALDIRKSASALSLEIVTLNPFGAFDGLAKEEDVEARLQEAELWLQICQILQAPILQLAACIYPLQKTLTADTLKIAANLKRLGLLAQKYNTIVAYEGVAWGIDVNTWQQVRDILGHVDLPNVRHCIDTFHIAAKEAGDPFNVLSPVKADGVGRLRNSMSEFSRTVKVSDIGYFQLSDATVADKEQTGYPMRDLKQPPFMTQSRNCRIFPCEHGVLPVLEVAKTVFEMGYRSWVSMEVFHPDMWTGDPG
ncbi:xylose isomerase-like protein [Dactylonectria estremocensis]|uniref:Xylose isomerase-like protein n=1 Tax=Dactylonectria estremocensis TaxID=1079267 RepID=A0A9P9D468_9HYPO|nr:xylose isomerase-like protein [Dactylonectria estremocensis]